MRDTNVTIHNQKKKTENARDTNVKTYYRRKLRMRNTLT